MKRWWDLFDAGTDADVLPPDLTPNTEIGSIRWCSADWTRTDREFDWCCTRLDGHTGRHAAGNGTHIVAVWP